ncbi:MAG TPA: hypothetical protein VH520_01440 [Streptosporangiaceae bacterium]|jgi:hypothetical protein
MRDPELMQRADRAAIALEEAWERWRAMHGLGSEPLPPVSSYVGYSLEEPWGQPRVVFGLRADEAELLASLLDGHDCVGPIYAEVSTRPDWRRSVNGPASQLARPYTGSLSVPAQAQPSPLDQLGLGSRAPDEDAEDDDDELDEPDRDANGLVDIGSDADIAIADGETARGENAGRSGAEAEADTEDGAPSMADGSSPSPALAPLPDAAAFRRAEEGAAGDDQPRPGTTKRGTGRGTVPAQGPGYRGPRYQGSPPRYNAGAAAKRSEQMPDGDGEEPDAQPTAPRRSHVTKLNRATRRRASGD